MPGHNGMVTSTSGLPPRRVVLLGATGSIGRQTCDVLRQFPDRFELVGAVARRDVAGLAAVVDRFGVARAALTEPAAGAALPDGWGRGMEAACDIARLEADVVVVAITGAAALRPTMAALEAGRTVATATKEVLVMAGDLVRDLCDAHGGQILPIDSEHSALWQCLRGERADEVARLVLTASGGPFRERDLATLAAVTVEEALCHPTWRMGPKVTIDSATMMNKGLEVIEAHHLFGVGYGAIDVVIHPSSTVHSYVEFVDGAVIAQLGIPDMRVPIALAISGGRRLPGIAPPPTLPLGPALCFAPVDPARFPAVELARAAGRAGGLAPVALNAADEIAVAAFLEGRLRFDEIVPLVASTVEVVAASRQPGLDEVVAADRWARVHATALVESRSGVSA